MKRLPIAIIVSDEVGLKSAMRTAIEKAEESLYEGEVDINFEPKHRVARVTFQKLVVDVSPRHNAWVYYFEAELEEL